MEKDKAASNPNESPGYQLWLASNLWQRRVRQALEPLGLTHVQFLVLAVADYLQEQGRIPSQVLVARTADIDEMMTSQVIRHLEDRGLLAREPDPADARAKQIVLTVEGMRISGEARNYVRQASEQLFKVLGEESKTLAALLRRVAETGD